MNLVLLTEGTGQGVRGRKTNVSRLYDLLIEGKNQRINLNHAIADVALGWILAPALERGLKALHRTTETSDCGYTIHDSLREPTNAWGALEPVKRDLGGVKRHALCDIIQGS